MAINAGAVGGDDVCYKQLIATQWYYKMIMESAAVSLR